MKRPLPLKKRRTKDELLKRKEKMLRRATPKDKELRAKRAPAQISNIGALNLFAKRS